MKSILPSFACLVVGAGALCPNARGQLPTAKSAAAGTAARASDSVSGDALLRRVLAAVDSHPSISAKLRYRVDLMGRSTIGSGIYLQQGRGAERQFRLELNLQSPSFVSRVRHVADGTDLWIVEELAGENRLARVDLARLRRATAKSEGAAANFDGWLALGGLPKLLASLDAAFEFGPVNESRLDELRVWSLVGHWQRERLANLLPEQKEAIDAGRAVDLGKLSPQLPDTIVVHVGCDDFFPYRIEYWRSDGPGGGNQAPDRRKLLVVMELYEVRLSGKIDPARFAFQPLGNMKPEDRTGQYLDKLGLDDAGPAGASKKSSPRR